LALLNSTRIALLDDQRAFNQLVSLERRTARSGRDTIDHPPGQHDDLINSIASVASVLIVKGTYNLDALADLDSDDGDPATYRLARFRNFVASVTGIVPSLGGRRPAADLAMMVACMGERGRDPRLTIAEWWKVNEDAERQRAEEAARLKREEAERRAAMPVPANSDWGEKWEREAAARAARTRP
jgi:hypothetical protein